MVWSTTSHWVLGVPYDMVLRARRNGGQTQIDLEDMVRINVNRLLYIGRVSGLWLGLLCFTLTSLALLAFCYDVEFAQAVFLLAFPMTFVGAEPVDRTADCRRAAPGELLRERLSTAPFVTQIIGMVRSLSPRCGACTRTVSWPVRRVLRCRSTMQRAQRFLEERCLMNLGVGQRRSCGLCDKQITVCGAPEGFDAS